jgi:hypothetical protein
MWLVATPLTSGQKPYGEATTPPLDLPLDLNRISTSVRTPFSYTRSGEVSEQACNPVRLCERPLFSWFFFYFFPLALTPQTIFRSLGEKHGTLCPHGLFVFFSRLLADGRLGTDGPRARGDPVLTALCRERETLWLGLLLHAHGDRAQRVAASAESRRSNELAAPTRWRSNGSTGTAWPVWSVGALK